MKELYIELITNRFMLYSILKSFGNNEEDIKEIEDKCRELAKKKYKELVERKREK